MLASTQISSIVEHSRRLALDLHATLRLWHSVAYGSLVTSLHSVMCKLYLREGSISKSFWFYFDRQCTHFVNCFKSALLMLYMLFGTLFLYDTQIANRGKTHDRSPAISCRTLKSSDLLHSKRFHNKISWCFYWYSFKLVISYI